MDGPYVSIDLDKIAHNARTITHLCARYGIEVTGVTKGTCGHPQVAQAMLRGGVAGIGESRLQNIHRLRESGIQAPFMLLRSPPLSEVDEVVACVDLSLNSEVSVVTALSEAASRCGVVHNIMVMVDLGDLREGVWPDDLLPFVRDIVTLPDICLLGLGTNLSCYGGVVPSVVNMQQLVACAEHIEDAFGLKLRYISGGNSSALPLLAAGHMPRQINHMRIGEGILLGRETVHRTAWPDTFQDAFLLHAEVIEEKAKPSIPIGETSQDAFGRRPTFVDQGKRVRALLNIGREDVDITGLTPCDPRLCILGASSDHLIVDVTAAQASLRVGDTLTFSMNYSALLAAMTSPYVGKRVLPGGRDMPPVLRE